jgi:DNA primase
MADFIDIDELKKRVSLVELLSRLGYEPSKKSGRELIYLSMLRPAESTPSLCVNDELGVWYDHGTGKGGTVIDFGKAYWSGLSFTEVLEKIRQVVSLEYSIVTDRNASEERLVRPRLPVKIPHYQIEDVKDLGHNPAITAYLEHRGVWDVAGNRLQEIYYYIEDQKKNRKQYFAAGWQNENGGWEVRNKYFKGCLGRKGMTFITAADQGSLVVFEGYMNYLSWLAEHKDSSNNILVLNSLSFLPAAIKRASPFDLIDVFFDHDSSGMLATDKFIDALPQAKDQSGVYQHYNDYNDKLMAESRFDRLVQDASVQARPDIGR